MHTCHLEPKVWLYFGKYGALLEGVEVEFVIPPAQGGDINIVQTMQVHRAIQLIRSKHLNSHSEPER